MLQKELLKYNNIYEQMLLDIGIKNIKCATTLKPHFGVKRRFPPPPPPSCTLPAFFG